MRVAVRSMFVVVVGASAALGRGAAADPAVATDAERPFSLVSVVGDVAIVTWDRASLERAAAGRKRFVVEQVPLAWDLHVDVALERFSVTGPTTRFVLGRRDGPDEPIDFDPSRIALFRGSVLGRAGSHVFLALCDTTSTGHVDLG
ncbi:MAG: hypothetical protein ACE5E6_12300, partial [Phycisphaerae bacterium]